LLLLAMAVVAVIGCGGLGITGGSVPIGTSRVRGIVTRADNLSQAVANAQVRLSVASFSSDRNTDAQGGFDFGRVTDGYFICSITPPVGSSLRGDWSWDYVVPRDTDLYMIATILPSSFNLQTVKRVALTPDNPRIKAGDSVRFQATVYDQNDQPIAVTPSLLLQNETGTLSPDGTFVATRTGKSKLFARIGDRTVGVNIEVIP
jgi:hypothetical protein